MATDPNKKVFEDALKNPFGDYIVPSEDLKNPFGDYIIPSEDLKNQPVTIPAGKGVTVEDINKAHKAEVAANKAWVESEKARIAEAQQDYATSKIDKKDLSYKEPTIGVTKEKTAAEKEQREKDFYDKYADKLVNKYGSLDEFMASDDWNKLSKAQQDRVSGIFSKYLPKPEPTLTDRGYGEAGGYGDAGKYTEEIAKEYEPKVSTQSDFISEDEAGGLRDWMSSQLEGVKETVGELGEELGLTKEIFQNKYNLAIQKANQNLSLSQSKYNSLQKDFKFLDDQYGEKYSDMIDRINNQESLVDTTFAEMRTNMNQIRDNYKTIQEIQSAGAAAASEKQLRAAGGKASASQIADRQAKLARQAAYDMANLDTQLLQQANALETNYLQMKDSIMKDKNIADDTRVKMLADLSNRLKDIEVMKEQAGKEYVAETTAPIEEQFKKMDEIEKATTIQNKINEVNMKWKNENPEYRKQVLSQVLQGLIGSGYSISQDIINQATTTDFVNSIKLIMNAVNSQVKSEKDKAEANNLLLQSLLRQGSGATTAASTETGGGAGATKIME